MSAKRRARKRHQFTVDELLRQYVCPLDMSPVGETAKKNQPDAQTKSQPSRAASIDRTKGLPASAGG
jgi:hypothetical protein